jgi:hypothetical protein
MTIEVRPVPKIIWCLWLQGWDKAPEIVVACAKSWRRMNPDWDVRYLEAPDVEAVCAELAAVTNFDRSAISAAALSDLIRLKLLTEHGGVWVDATTYCLSPLDDWLSEAAPQGFFAFDRPAPDRMISSWFLAASPRHPLICRWLSAAEDYWRDRSSPYAYFWLRYLFADQYAADPDFRAIWDATPKHTADGPHALAPYEDRLFGPLTAEIRVLVETASTPLLKLTHKIDHDAPSATSVYRWLCEQDRSDQWRQGASRRSPRILVSWYGSIAGHGTVGDLLAVQAVVEGLIQAGFNVAHLSATSQEGLPPSDLTLDSVDPAAFDVLIFVCGPIIRDHPTLDTLVGKFDSCTRLAVSVSLMARDAENFSQPFDFVLAREGSEPRFADVAILAPTVGQGARRSRGRAIRIGLALRGPQGEYGQCLDAQVLTLAQDAADELGLSAPVEVFEIEHHLARGGRSAAEIGACYEDADLIITSRFHGGVLALRHEIPFIAIDQIEGGAKVSSLLGDIGWPYVFRADLISEGEVRNAARALVIDPPRQMLRAARAKCMRDAEATMAALVRLL